MGTCYPSHRALLGLAVAAALSVWTAAAAQGLNISGFQERVLALMHVPGDGRFVLRIGGDSSDRSFWDPDIRRLPHWAFEVTPDFVERTAKRRDGGGFVAHARVLGGLLNSRMTAA